MASTSLPRPRPLTPLEEDLQRLYNEVWQGFVEEEPAQSSERDLETIYNGYAGDYASPTTSSNTLQPQPPPPGMLSKFVDVFLFHGLLVSREPSPYRPPVETNNIPVTPNKPSPTRRRLPPTPGTSSSPFATMAMPEPHPFQPPDVPVAKPYPSTLSFESVRRKTEDSPNSHGGRRLPPEPGYTNGSNTWSDGNKTSVSSMDYQSQVSIASNTSYTSSNSLGSNRKNVSGEAHVRPLGAAPPVLPPKPTTYPEDVKDTWNPFQPSTTRMSMHRRQQMDMALRKQPLLTHMTRTYHRLHHLPSLRAARIFHTLIHLVNTPMLSRHLQVGFSAILARITAKKFLVSDMNLFASSSKTGYFDEGPYQALSGRAQDLIPENEPLDDPPPDPKEENWDDETYMYADRKTKPQMRTDDASVVPSSLPRRPTEMLQALGDYEQQPVDIQEPSQDDGYWDDEEEDDARFINFSLLSNIAMQLRDKVPRGTHVKGSIPYPRAFTGKDIVVCPLLCLLKGRLAY